MFVRLDTTKSIGFLFFSTGIIAFFFINCCCINLLGPYRKKLKTCTLNVKRLFRLYKLFSDICHVRYYEKSGPQCFFLWKDCLLFRNLCFQQPVRCYRKHLITSTVIVKLTFWPSKNVPKSLSHSMKRETLAKTFLHWKVYRFLSKKLYFRNLLGLEEMIL